MTPQSVNAFGGHKVQGRGERGDQLIEEALAVERAGAFSIVLELIPAELAARITAALSVPTIGIGAGPGCSGQIQVFHDVVGLAETAYRHAARRGEVRLAMRQALSAYCEEARSRAFPSEENSF
jgi:3-methyl-2-oxobutanoate hydroxymethyltransferase